MYAVIVESYGIVYCKSLAIAIYMYIPVLRTLATVVTHTHSAGVISEGTVTQPHTISLSAGGLT